MYPGKRSVFVDAAVLGTPGPACGSTGDVSVAVRHQCSPNELFAVDMTFHSWSASRWPAVTKQVAYEKESIASYMESIPAYPADEFSGRGIVIVAGGKYLLDAFATIAAIRGYGSKLRIQIWHLGADELPPFTAALFKQYNVESRDFYDYTDTFATIESNVGFRKFQLKPYALLFTDLEEVMIIDADNTPIKDPAFLFDDKEYRKVGSLFWPDYWKTHPENPIWELTGVRSRSDWEQESGQMVVNKKLAWRAINLCSQLQSGLYYSILNGDKDTFRFAWLATGVDFVMNEHWPLAIGSLRGEGAEGAGADNFCAHTMGQQAPDGSLLFVHHFCLSW